MTWKQWIFLTLGLVAIDQGVGWAVMKLTPRSVVSNHKLFFGLLQQPVIIAVVLLVAAVVLWQLRSVVAQRRNLAIALSLIAAGGLANIIDRVVYGGVVDYVPFAHWFIFNLADAEISVGTTMFILAELIQQRPSEG